jgi:EF hand
MKPQEQNMTSSFKTLISSTVLVLASATAFGALAQAPTTPATPAAPTQGPRTPGQGLKALDTNGDKMISRDEAKGHPKLEKHFDAIDTNKDGQLSREEMKAYRQAHKGEGKSQPKS